MKIQNKAYTEGMLSSEALDFVKRVKLGFIATRQDDGKSILSDKGTLTVFDRRHLVFAELASHETVEHIKCNPGVTVEVVDHLTRRGYLIQGKGKLIAFNIEGDPSLSAYQLEGTDEEREKYFLLIEIESCEEISTPKFAWISPLADLRSRWKMNHTNPWKF